MSCSEQEITHLIQPLLLNVHMHRVDLCQLPALCIHSFQSWQNIELHPLQPPQIMFEKLNGRYTMVMKCPLTLNVWKTGSGTPLGLCSSNQFSIPSQTDERKEKGRG